jgi:Kef-type K+ transport system membrane component KefB/nucleotide-binding universal stress UspA family protein
MLITPISNPVAIFTLIISIILFVPFISKRLNIPSIFGLIVAGLIIGPNGTGLLENNQSVSMFATVGLLYIMFLAGLEINFNSFLQNRNKSIFFGAATFFVPLIIGFVILRYVMQFTFLPALLVSSMFSTHTLISYPIVSRLNITRRESVIITIGGTIITDTAVLVLFSIITAAYEGKLNGMFWFQLIFLLIVFVFAVLWGLPKIARWYFNTFQSDSIQQYVFILVALFLSAMLAKFAGIEPIVGAFLSGLALNRVIPHHSPLMNRTVFIGNSIFIPFFLISVGMLVNLKILFAGFETVSLAVVLIIVAITGKYLAAFFTQLIFRYSRADRNLIFGLSSSHAAATIAIILIGFQIGILDEKVLNGTILLILVTCMVSSFMTEYAGRTIAIEEADPANELASGPERILVPVSNPDTIQKLIDLAILTRSVDSETVIYPISIVNDDEDAQLAVMNNKKIMEQLSAHAIASDIMLSPITRVDINIPTGISRVVKELLVTKIILGWSGLSSTANYFFGNIIDNLLEHTQQMVMVVKVEKPITHLRQILVLVPANADREIGFAGWINSLISLSKSTGGKIIFLTNAATIVILKNRLKEYKFFNGGNYVPYEYYPNVSAIPVEFSDGDMIIAIAARPSTVSFSRRQMVIPKFMSHFAQERDFIIIYPEQVEVPMI